MGNLFVFEGPDGVGKSSIAKLFVEYLRANGTDCRSMAFPGNEPGSLGKHVYEVHHDPRSFGIEGIHPMSLQMLHVAAHIDAIHDQIFPALSAGRTIVLDRFWWSTRVYGLVSGISESEIDAVIAPEMLVWQQRLPDQLFLIDREFPLRAEPMEQWEQWRREYRSLHEAPNNLSSHCIVNDSQESALAKVIALAS